MAVMALGAMVLAWAAAAGAVTADQQAAFERDLAGALLDMGLATRDCRIRLDYATPDSFRLPLVDSLMNDPTSLLRRVDGIASGIERDTSLAGMVGGAWKAMSVEAQAPAGASGPAGTSSHIRDVRGQFAHLPDAVRKPIETYLGRIALASELREGAIADVAANLDFLRENAIHLVIPQEEHPDVSPFELDSLETADTAIGDSVLALATKIKVPLVAAMSLAATDAADALRREIERASGAAAPAGDEAARSLRCLEKVHRYHGGRVAWGPGKTVPAATGDLLYLGLTDWGPIAIGDSGPNTYSGAFAVIIDLGGDDTYHLTSQPGADFSLIIDVAGNDIYQSSDDACLAGAVFGTSVILDLAGNDTYQAGHVSLGAGIFGAGVLYDRQGVDTYTSGGFSQGAGFLGVGLCIDEAGNDCYTAAMQSQAFGYVMGTGVLLDRSGNDTYLTKLSQTDILRYDDHYLSLSQGCAFGYRPDYSGGIGLLIDSGGNDLYSSDIFGQGAGYWYCVGAIVDRGGHDRYSSYQYAQGSGIHLGFGLLEDEWGDDYYVSKGVSQGCGHDLALGLLADFSGNDCYTAVDLSQGAGSANGTGILYDADGVDSYSCKSKVNVNGYGDYRREFGSIGLQIDTRGTDYYAARGANESVWEGSHYGFGIDFPGEVTKPRGDIVVKEYPFQERAFSTKELYVLAMRSEPRFQAWRKYAFDKMVVDSAASIEYLRTVIDTKDATKRNAIKDILVKIGTPAVPMLCDEVRHGNDRAKSEASWILGLMETPAAFDALMDLSRSEDWRQRSGALNSLARLKGLSDADERELQKRAEDVFADGGEVFYVKKDAAFVVGSRKYYSLIPDLVACLSDVHYSVRYSAAEALRQLAREATTATPDVPGRIAGALKAAMPGLDPLGLVPAVYAATDLPAEMKMDVAETALGLKVSRETEVAVAIAELLKPLAPEQEAQRRRLTGLIARLPQAWEVKSVFE
jgi:HEAT repeat